MTDVQTGTDKASTVAKMTLPTLTAMVVGSMIGAGVFSLPARFGLATGVLGALVAWAIAGTGMLMLAFVFQNLAIRKPDARRRRVRLREGRLRRLRRLQLGVRLLGERVRRQHLLLGVHHDDDRRAVPGARRGRHDPRGRAVVGRRLGVPLPDRPRRQGSRDRSTGSSPSPRSCRSSCSSSCVARLVQGRRRSRDNFWGGQEASFSTLYSTRSTTR